MSHLEVFRVCADLRDQVQPQPAVAPHTMLLQQVGDEQQQPAVVLDPPDINEAGLRLVVGGEVLGGGRWKTQALD